MRVLPSPSLAVRRIRDTGGLELIEWDLDGQGAVCVPFDEHPHLSGQSFSHAFDDTVSSDLKDLLTPSWPMCVFIIYRPACPRRLTSLFIVRLQGNQRDYDQRVSSPHQPPVCMCSLLTLTPGRIATSLISRLMLNIRDPEVREKPFCWPSDVDFSGV